MIRNTSILTENIPEEIPDRWLEFISSVTIIIPKKWEDEAEPFRLATTILWIDMKQHMIRLTEGFCAFTGGQVYPNIFIKSVPFLPDPKIEIDFWKDGIADFDEDGELKDGRIILNEWDIVRVSDYAKLTFFNETVKFRNAWMARQEAIFAEKGEMEYA